jgi:hypothetical protein
MSAGSRHRPLVATRRRSIVAPSRAVPAGELHDPFEEFAPSAVSDALTLAVAELSTGTWDVRREFDSYRDPASIRRPAPISRPRKGQL